ncbi:redoxin domain-containing protein [Mizugakiibacter sediminis]|uniref:Redoxin domain-containing protein n=1 Tax=Mizugakiibacter sediminis TaxID=1475481 RepID=A0A0K8QLM7_9GAMM|nr:redoxin family protein [Mizugakiibacter sediminis]GAP65840.1 redoxin domain-containing protein [Mizugakiibacter sediminis]
MPIRLLSAAGAVLISALVMLPLWRIARGESADPVGRPLPAFTRTDASGWLNSPPLRVEDLRGRVLLVDVWAFECWNCYRSFPWLHQLERSLAGRDFRVIGIHSPELEREYLRQGLEAAVARHGVREPVMIDNDHAYWRALGNQYWPAFYLVDRRGRIRARFVGETHPGDAQAQRIEAAVRALLAES